MVDELFTLLELEKVGNELFKNPLFSWWVTLVEQSHSKDYEATAKVVLSTLAKHYGEDAALADVLVAGTEILNMKTFASNLVAIQLEKWLYAGKSVDQVFTLLKLENVGKELFKNPRLILWLHFVGARYDVGRNEAYKLARKSAEELAKKANKTPADEAAR